MQPPCRIFCGQASSSQSRPACCPGRKTCASVRVFVRSSYLRFRTPLSFPLRCRGFGIPLTPHALYQAIDRGARRVYPLGNVRCARALLFHDKCGQPCIRHRVPFLAEHLTGYCSGVSGRNGSLLMPVPILLACGSFGLIIILAFFNRRCHTVAWRRASIADGCAGAAVGRNPRNSRGHGPALRGAGADGGPIPVP